MDHSGDGASVLVVRDLWSRATLHRWPLPRKHFTRACEWKCSSQVLAISYGSFFHRRDEKGVLLVDTATGSCVCVNLTHHLADASDVSPFHTGWSSADYLLAQHVNEAGPATARIFDARGQLVSSLPLPQAGGCAAGFCPEGWSPSGSVALLHVQQTP